MPQVTRLRTPFAHDLDMSTRVTRSPALEPSSYGVKFLKTISGYPGKTFLIFSLAQLIYLGTGWVIWTDAKGHCQ